MKAMNANIGDPIADMLTRIRNANALRGKPDRRRDVKGFFALSCCVLLAVGAIAGERRLSLADYRDKMRGAWIGQIAGVCFGGPTEFKWKDAKRF